MLVTSSEHLNIDNIDVCIGWTESVDRPLDLDGSILMLGEDKMLVDEKCFIFYNSTKCENKAIFQYEDNPPNEENSDWFHIELNKIDNKVKYILFCISLYDTQFELSLLKNVFVKFVDVCNWKNTLWACSISEFLMDSKACVLCGLKKDGGLWAPIAIGNQYEGGLEDIINKYYKC